ncbi:MAG: glycosyltransferase [Planctomycetes bacterium]|nr:glycosyltransferase [Planctomycetota bacterium]
MNPSPRDPLRILLVGYSQPGALELSYKAALSRIPGVQADLFSIDAGEGRPANPSLVSRALHRLRAPGQNGVIRKRLEATLKAARQAPDCVVVFKGMVFSRESLEKCAQASPKTIWVNLNPDDATNIEAKGSSNADVLGSLSFYDLYVTWSRSLAVRLKDGGCRRVERIPFGYDAEVHRPPAGGENKTPTGVSFVGTWDRERESALAAVADMDLRVFGGNWKRVKAGSPLRSRIHDEALHGDRFAREIHSSLVSINLLRPQNRDSHNMRTFEIPAVGGLMLTQASAELPEFLAPGEACLTFETPREMRERIEQVLRNPGDFVRVRERGLRMISSHSYDARAAQLVGCLAELVSTRRAEPGGA